MTSIVKSSDSCIASKLPRLSCALALALGLLMSRGAVIAQEKPADQGAAQEKTEDESDKKPETKPVQVRKVIPRPIKPGPARPVATPKDDVPAPTVQLKEGEVPQVEFDTPAYNFGKVEYGETVVHEYWFTNTGTGPLEILKVKPACGCTKAGDHDRVVQPGETGKIPIRFSPKNRGGHANKTITVWTNVAGPNGRVVLRIEGETWEPLAVSPDPLMVAEVQEDDSTQEVTFINNTEDKIGVAEVEVVDKKITAKFTEVTPDKQYNITLSFPKGYELPKGGTDLVIKTNNPKMPERRVPIRIKPSHTPGGKPGQRLVGKPAPAFTATAAGGRGA